MKIVESFAVLLVAGILSVTVAQDHVARSPRQSSQRSFDSSETNRDMMSTFHPGLEEFLRPKCMKNGGPKAFDTFIQGTQDLVTCVQSVAATLKTADFSDRTNAGIENGFRSLCSKVPDFRHCVDSTREPMTICFDSKDRNSSRILNNVVNALLDFLCADNARHITEFFEDNGLACLMSKKSASQKCVDQFLTEVSDHKLHNATSVFGIEQCTTFENVQRCYVKVLMECKQQTPSHLMNSLFNVAIQQTPCKDILKSSSARINLLSTTSLMGIVMSMLLI